MQLEPYMRIPGFSQRLGIFHGDIELEIVLIHALEPLDDVQLITVGTAGAIEPSLIIETNCIHNQSIAFPAANRIAHISRSEVVGMLAPVGKDMADRMVIFIQNHDLFRSLYELQWEGLQIDSRHAWRVTLRDNRIVCLL